MRLRAGPQATCDLEDRIAAGREGARVPTLLALTFAALLLQPAPARALTLYGLVNTGELYASGDGGASWSIHAALPVRDAAALVAGATGSQLLLASRSGSFYRSEDAGLSWAAISAVPSSDVTAMVSSTQNLMLLTQTGDVYRSLDAGASWSVIGAVTASDVVSAARSGSEDVALTASGTVHRSLDGGTSWSAVGTLPTSRAVEIVVLAGALYVLTSSGDVARSDDRGLSWSFVGALSQTGMTALLATHAELVASTRAGECAASAGGTSWTWRGTIGQIEVVALASDIPTTGGVPPPDPPGLAFPAPWPSPAPGAAHVSIELERPAVVTVEAYDAAGRIVGRPIHEELLPAGITTRVWRPSLPSGTYFLHARGGGADRTRRLVWLSGR